jgi:carbon monoxide dehydrogenase subunit G
MNFTCSIDIEVPIDKVVALFNDTDNFKEWQDGFISYETFSGTPDHIFLVSF